MADDIFSENKTVNAVLISLMEKSGNEREQEASFDELERLCDTAGAVVFARMIQQKEKPDVRTYIGSGKVEELKAICLNNDIDLVVFDCELSPSQIRNLEDDIGSDVRVIDRSMLILDIFALHAVTGEGKLQVELAQLKYTVPRLTGRGTEMSRLGGSVGGIGSRGPGESKLETDRRHVHRRMEMLESQIEEMAKNRAVIRAARDRNGIFKFAIAGYTNAGKSTLLNRLTDAGILSEDKLFATLDPTTRKYTLPGGEEILLTDTVGFIRNLPTHLIKAFRSTLDEVCYADAVLVLIDASDENADSELLVTQSLLRDLGASDKPVLYVYNKCDKSREVLVKTDTDQTVYISALTGNGIEKLLFKMEEIVHSKKKKCTFEIPNNRLGLINTLYSNAAVSEVLYGDSFATVTAVVDNRIAGSLSAYLKKE